jgi:ribonuclease D
VHAARIRALRLAVLAVACPVMGSGTVGYASASGNFTASEPIGDSVHHWIEHPAELSALLESKPARIGLDTEFVRERTYWPKLALVQIALREVGDSPRVLLVDPLAPGMTAALAPLLADRDVLKIMHSAGEDLIALRQACGALPQPLFDTQVAAALAGIGTGLGYQKLVQELEGVALAKGETRSDWLRRPLSPAQLEYAADDVRHLHAMHEALDAKLQALGRIGWLEQDCARMIAGAERDEPERWPHLPLRAAQFLDAAGQHRLLRLLRWRDAQARRSDRPRAWILDNELAVALARTPPADPDELQSRLDAQPKAPRKLTAALWQALITPLPDEALAPPIRGDDVDKKALRSLQDAVSGLSAELGLPDGVLASRRWLEALLEGRWPDALSGWRRELLEPRLAALLPAGRVQPASV